MQAVLKRNMKGEEGKGREAELPFASLKLKDKWTWDQIQKVQCVHFIMVDEELWGQKLEGYLGQTLCCLEIRFS